MIVSIKIIFCKGINRDSGKIPRWYSQMGAGAAKILSCHSLIPYKDRYLHVLSHTVIKKENFRKPMNWRSSIQKD